MRRPRLAVTALFVLLGLGFTSYLARLPAIKDRLDLTDGELGLALLASSAGVLAGQPVAAFAISRLGSRPVAWGAGVAFAAAVALPGQAGSLGQLAAVLLLVGLVSGLLDVSMNVQGVAVERLMPHRIFNGLHAAYSFGALAGAGLGGLAAEAGLTPATHLSVVAAAGVAAAALAGPALLAAEDAAPGRAFPKPERRLATLALLAFACLLAEGSVADWSAVHLNDTIGATESVAALGLAVFSLTQGLARLVADRAADAFGPPAIVRWGGALATAGMLLAVVAGSPLLGIVGFGLVGIGLSAAFPLALNAAGRRAVEVPGAAVASISAAGYGGLVTGPALIGLLAESTSLRAALVVTAVCCALVAVLGAATRE